MSDVKSAVQYSFGRRLILLLGSMNLAISLLIVLAIASVIGTVLQQNQPYSDYVIKFGPFWFDVFEAAGLYDVYSALWFLIILALLVVSTTTCLIRNTPSMIKEMMEIRTDLKERSLVSMQHSDQWQMPGSHQQTANMMQAALSEQGYRVRQVEKEGGVLVSAMKGSLNRLGYLFTHIAIVVICLGGLLDSNLPIKFAEWRGELKVETRNLGTDEVPKESRIPVGNNAFRGSIQIPEGRVANVAFLPLRDGYIVQELPFVLKVEDFRIEHYATGQPKSFETDLVIFDETLAEPIRETISVNHPLIHRGYAIYQSSFADGGSHLKLEAWPIDHMVGDDPVMLNTRVFDKRRMPWGEQGLQLEITSFRPFNINPDPTEEDPDNIRDFGPSFEFKLRTPTGEAKEYVNYMAPVLKDGRAFFLSGVRSSQADQFGYLYVPMDRQGTLKGFSDYLERIRDMNLVKEIASTMAVETLQQMSSNGGAEVQNSLQETLERLVGLFIQSGFTGVSEFIETTLPEAQREKIGPAYMSMLREMLARIYFINHDQSKPVSEADLYFLQDAADAIGSLSRYDAPVYLKLKDYQHIQASGLQVASTPGKMTVYVGCALLVIGVFILFYMPQIRFWVMVKTKSDESDIVLAGMSNRNPRDFDLLFEQTRAELRTKTGNSVER